ncbi:MAG: FecR family protein [Bacteroidales bacterium]|nr:FecR family protein [Bacteroidales bacterium]
MNIELLRKYFSNRCTQEELQTLLEWFTSGAETTEGRNLLYTYWEEIQADEEELPANYEGILDRIHHKVNLIHTKTLEEKPFGFLSSGTGTFWRVFSRIAAVLMLPLLGFSVLMSVKFYTGQNGIASGNQAYNEVFSSVDAISKVTLPDGSRVWLNHGSSLKYPAVFRGRSRDVELHGEAYFEVVSNRRVPFVVSAGDIQIMATGTEFNVMAYPEEDKIETSLIKGVVVLQRSDPGKRKVTLVEMKPADMVIYHKSDKKITQRIIDDDRYFAWKDGKLVFHNEPLGEVAKKLSRWFNVEIEIADPKLLELTYTATFVDENLQQVMELMSLISPVNYTISNRQEKSQGIFSKRKVVLYYRNK